MSNFEQISVIESVLENHPANFSRTSTDELGFSTEARAERERRREIRIQRRDIRFTTTPQVFKPAPVDAKSQKSMDESSEKMDASVNMAMGVYALYSTLFNAEIAKTYRHRPLGYRRTNDLQRISGQKSISDKGSVVLSDSGVLRATQELSCDKEQNESNPDKFLSVTRAIISCEDGSREVHTLRNIDEYGRSSLYGTVSRNPRYVEKVQNHIASSLIQAAQQEMFEIDTRMATYTDTQGDLHKQLEM